LCSPTQKIKILWFCSITSLKYFIIVSLNKILVLINKFITYNWVYKPCLKIKYLFLHSFLNFFNLVKYYIIFTWFSHKMIILFSNMCILAWYFLFNFIQSLFICVFISIIILLGKKLILINKVIKHN
jgi:hypothetical protein